MNDGEGGEYFGVGVPGRVGEVDVEGFEVDQYGGRTDEMELADAPLEVQEVQEKLLGLELSEPKPWIASHPEEVPLVQSAIRGAYTAWREHDQKGSLDDFLALVRREVEALGSN